MNKDIFDFWAEAAPTDTTHPTDRNVLARVSHRLDLRCLPTPFNGPLRTAPVVLLYLAPGWAQEDVDEACTPEGHARLAELRKGYQPLAGPDDYKPDWKWWSSRTRAFGPWREIHERVAILDISGYHSKTFADAHVLAALPSSRVALDWAQEVLFPEAESGKRVVICMRSPQYWGLGKKSRYGEALFVPEVTRGGHMRHGAVREAVVAAAVAAIAKS